MPRQYRRTPRSPRRHSRLPSSGCPFCGSPRTREVLSEGERSLLFCPACVLGFVSPLVSGEKLSEILREAAAKRLPRERAPLAIEYMGRHDGVVLDFLESRTRAGDLLEIGCGRGILLSNARERGWRVKGVEPARPTAEEGIRERGLDIFIGTLAEAGLDRESFDAVLMCHSLEHIPDPRRELEMVGRLLKKGGWLYVETPNWTSLSRRILGTGWWNVDLMNHLYYFSSRSLEMACRAAGLELREGRGIHFDPLALLVRLAHLRDPAFRDLNRINESRDRVLDIRGAWRLFSALESACRLTLGRSLLNDYLAFWFRK